MTIPDEHKENPMYGLHRLQTHRSVLTPFSACAGHISKIDKIILSALDNANIVMNTQQRGDFIAEISSYMTSRLENKLAFLPNSYKPHVIMIAHKGAELHKLSRNNFNALSAEKKSEYVFIGQDSNGFIQNSVMLNTLISDYVNSNDEAEYNTIKNKLIKNLAHIDTAIQNSLRIKAREQKNGIYSDIYYNTEEYITATSQAQMSGYKNRTSVFYRPLRNILKEKPNAIPDDYIKSYVNMLQILSQAIIDSTKHNSDMQLARYDIEQSAYALIFRMEDGVFEGTRIKRLLKKMFQNIHQDQQYIMEYLDNKYNGKINKKHKEEIAQVFSAAQDAIRLMLDVEDNAPIDTQILEDQFSAKNPEPPQQEPTEPA